MGKKRKETDTLSFDKDKKLSKDNIPSSAPKLPPLTTTPEEVENAPLDPTLFALEVPGDKEPLPRYFATDKRPGAWVLKFKNYKTGKWVSVIFPINAQELSLSFDWRQQITKTRGGLYVHYWPSGFGYADHPQLTANFTSGTIWVWEKGKIPTALKVYHKLQQMIQSPRAVGGYPNIVKLYVETPLYPGVTFHGVLSQGISISESATNPATYNIQLTMTVLKTIPKLENLGSIVSNYEGFKK